MLLHDCLAAFKYIWAYHELIITPDFHSIIQEIDAKHSCTCLYSGCHPWAATARVKSIL